MQAFVQTVDKQARKTARELQREEVDASGSSGPNRDRRRAARPAESRGKQGGGRKRLTQVLKADKEMVILQAPYDPEQRELEQKHQDEGLMRKHISDRLQQTVAKKVGRSNFEREKKEKDRARYMLRKIAKDVEEQDKHQQRLKQVIRKTLRAEAVVQKKKKEEEEEKYARSVGSAREELSDLNSLVNQG
jgi:hypothetical protein